MTLLAAPSSCDASHRALDEAAAYRLKCNELDGVSWSHKDKLSKAQEALAPLRKRADAAEQMSEKYERQLEEAKQAERQMRGHVSQLEKENRDLKSDVQSLAAEKQCMRLELLQANLENDKVCCCSRPLTGPVISCATGQRAARNHQISGAGEGGTGCTRPPLALGEGGQVKLMYLRVRRLHLLPANFLIPRDMQRGHSRGGRASTRGLL